MRRGRYSKGGRGKGADGLLSDSRKEVGLEGGSMAAREGKINKQSRRGSDSLWHQERAGLHVALLAGWQLEAGSQWQA